MINNQYETISRDDKLMAMLAHFSGIITFIGPLAIWIIKKDQSKFVDSNGKVALNFQLTMLIGFLIAGILPGFYIGSILSVINIILCIVSGMKAYNGLVPSYPFSIIFIK